MGKKDLATSQRLAGGYIMRMKNCKQRLSEIAMRPNVMPSTEYLNMMITNERNNQKPGYLGRIEVYEDLKCKSKLLDETTDPHYDPLKHFVKDDSFVRVMGEPKKASGFFSSWW